VLDDGATMRVRGGLLEIYSRGINRFVSPRKAQSDKTVAESNLLHFDAGPHHRKPKAIIFAGWGGSLTLQATRFCIDHHITVLATGWLGDLTTFVTPRPAQDAAFVRAQCVARPAFIAREIVIQKFRHYLATRRMTTLQFRDFSSRLIRAHTLDTILNLEATGSSLAWSYWSGLQLMPRTGRTLPIWLARPFRHRASAIGTSGARHAMDPINAMLNLAYAKEAGRLGSFLAASGVV
jgi:CRISPR/Cas system-associated endonuclease Cas1